MYKLKQTPEDFIVEDDDLKLESSRVITNIDSKIEISEDGFIIHGIKSDVSVSTDIEIDENKEYGVIVYKI